GGVLVAKPQRQPGAVLTLVLRQEGETAVYRIPGIGVLKGKPFPQGANRMRGQVATAAIERELGPTPTEGRPATVAVLKVQQPEQSFLNISTNSIAMPPACPSGIQETKSRQRSRLCGRRSGSERGLWIQETKGEQRPRRVVGIRHAAGPRRPTPAT